MVTKSTILKRCDKYLSSNKNSFAWRVCKSLKDGVFFDVLSSQELTELLNEGAGKKIKVNNLTASMETLLKEDIVKTIFSCKGRNKRKLWFPGWVDRQKAKQKIIPASSKENVLFFTGNNPWTDPNNNFPKLIDLIQGDLYIVDPYYGNGTFYMLAKFGKKRNIKFLSCELGGEEKKNISRFEIGLKRFRKEFKKIEIRVYDKPYELHDRYIIAGNALVIVGHGIKDLSNKESFVIFLPKKLVDNFLPILKKRFEERWKKAKNLK